MASLLKLCELETDLWWMRRYLLKVLIYRMSMRFMPMTMLCSLMECCMLLGCRASDRDFSKKGFCSYKIVLNLVVR